jgi:hypothetical protein
MPPDSIIIAIGGIVVALLNGFFLIHISRKVDIIKVDINSRMTELLRISGDAREAIGKLAGKAEQKLMK